MARTAAKLSFKMKIFHLVLLLVCTGQSTALDEPGLVTSQMELSYNSSFSTMEKEKDVRTLVTQYMMYKIGKLHYMFYLFEGSDTTNFTVFKLRILTIQSKRGFHL